MEIRTDKIRLEYIDGLRGTAILLVLLTHTWVCTGAPALSFHVMHHVFVLAAIPAIGWVGVNLFLVISGFCLAFPFLRNPDSYEKTTIWQFWMRRVRRIAPTYYASIAAVFVLCAGFGLVLRVLPTRLLAGHDTTLNALPSWKEVVPHLFLVHNLFQEHVSTINGSYWSLALEFQLYLMFPLLLALFFRWGPWRTLVLVMVLQGTYRFWLSHELGSSILDEYQFVLPKAIFGRMFDFCLGMTAAYVVTRRNSCPNFLIGKAGLWISLVVLSTAFVLPCVSTIDGAVTDFLWAVGFAALVCRASSQQAMCHRALRWKPLVGLGYISYSVYLIHQPLIERTSFIIRLFLKPGSAFFVGLLCIPLIILVAIGFFRIFEAPLLQRKPLEKPLDTAKVSLSQV